MQSPQKYGGAHAFAHAVHRNVRVTLAHQLRDLPHVVGHAIPAGPDSILRCVAKAALVERVDEKAVLREKRTQDVESTRMQVEAVHGDDRRARRLVRNPTA